jgi:hypothetical protein
MGACAFLAEDDEVLIGLRQILERFADIDLALAAAADEIVLALGAILGLEGLDGALGDREGAVGMARSRSMPMLRPKPRQVGQAPRGLLKEKRPGEGGAISISQWAQCQPVEKGRISVVTGGAFFAVAGMTRAGRARAGGRPRWPRGAGSDYRARA